MDLHHTRETAGGWARLLRAGATVGLDRWPGPQGPGTVIHTSGAGYFRFSHLDPDADGGPEAVYHWARLLSSRLHHQHPDIPRHQHPIPHLKPPTRPSTT